MKGPRLPALALVSISGSYLLFVLIAWSSWQITLLADLERLAYDLRLSASSHSQAQDPRFLLVSFDERTVEKTRHRSPLDRKALAAVLRRLDAMQPRMIGLDILFDQPTVPEEDAGLVKALRDMKTPFWLPAGVGDSDRLLAPWQRTTLRRFVQQALGKQGHPTSAVLYPDSDGVVRRTAPPGRAALSSDLAKAAGSGASLSDLPIDFRSGSSGEPAFARLSAVDLIEAAPEALEALKSVVDGRIVLVGAELDNVDRHRTPITRFADEATVSSPAEQSRARRDLSGLEVQAQIIATSLDAGPDKSGEPSQFALWLLVLVPPGLGILVGWLRSPALVRIITMVGGTVAVVALSFFWEQAPGVQTYGLPVIGSIVAWLSLALVTNAFGAAATNNERQLAREIGRRYLPPQVAREIERHPELLEVHGQRVSLAIVFTDLAGFTSLSEKLEPDVLGKVLNDYLDGMTEVIMRRGGTLDKFIGDAVVCFWGAPLADANSAEHALNAALELQSFASAHRKALSNEGIELGETRIGVHYGEAIVGNFGSRRRVQYTAMGDAMNLAARLESANKQLGTEVLASAPVIQAANWTLGRDLGAIIVKGREEPCGVFQLDIAISEDTASAHARLLARLRAHDEQAQKEFDTLVADRPEDLALKLMSARAHHAGWSGPYRLESK